MKDKGSESIFIDIGSSSVKIYTYSNQKLKLLQTKSISLKDGLTPETGFTSENKKTLFNLIKAVRKDYQDASFSVFATALFRKLSKEEQQKIQEQLLENCGVSLTILSHEEENAYLELALLGKYTTDLPVLLINIGGGSTELVVVKNETVTERHNIDIGVGRLLNQFSQINELLSGVSLEEVKGFVKKHLPSLQVITPIAFYTGGELTYMKLASYPLEKNSLFQDEDHPSIITTTNFAKRNADVFTKVTIKELESLMPDNPTWMHGARACSAFAQAICESYGVDTIIPSDSNLVNGIVRKEFGS